MTANKGLGGAIGVKACSSPRRRSLRISLRRHAAFPAGIHLAFAAWNEGVVVLVGLIGVGRGEATEPGEALEPATTIRPVRLGYRRRGTPDARF